MEFLKEKNEEKAIINMIIPAEMKEALKERAEQLNVKMSDLVRLYISRGLEQGKERKE